MLSFLAVGLAALLTAGLTLYSGFGLGTLLLPVFALFFPIELAVFATAVVHGANNVFKVSLVGRYADWSMVSRFGVPAVLAAIAGAGALAWVAGFEPLLEYRLGSRLAVVTPVKLAVGLLMFGFALFELLPRFRHVRFDREHLVVGGLLSGFFGGFSGHQGALRSAFLVKTGISTEAFVGTSSMIGLMVDLVRLLTYAALFVLVGQRWPLTGEHWPLIGVGCVCAFTGVLIGKQFLHKVTMGTVQKLTGTLLLLVAVALGAGLI
ncbi:MAG: TSUP family transporter [Xanthomonadales bacterium]|nr:TSUP family transporter [Xanthomonadales bacterium]